MCKSLGASRLPEVDTAAGIPEMLFSKSQGKQPGSNCAHYTCARVELSQGKTIIWERGCCFQEGKDKGPSIPALKDLLAFLSASRCPSCAVCWGSEAILGLIFLVPVFPQRTDEQAVRQLWVVLREEGSGTQLVCTTKFSPSSQCQNRVHGTPLFPHTFPVLSVQLWCLGSVVFQTLWEDVGGKMCRQLGDIHELIVLHTRQKQLASLSVCLSVFLKMGCHVHRLASNSKF